MSLAIENLERMLAAGQENALLRFGLGKAYLDQRAYDAAIGHLSKAVELDHQYSAAWKLLGKAYAGADLHDEATAAFETGIRVAEEKGDLQAVKEMQVFLRRLKPVE